MLKVMDRFIPVSMYTEELEINREQVFMPTKFTRYQKEFITAYTASVIINFGAVEFQTLRDLEKQNENNRED
jgi:hypothetical protein